MASKVLVSHFFLFNSLGSDGKVSPDDGRRTGMIPPEIYQTPIEKLELSPRTLNSLKRAQLRKVGEVLEMTNEELFRIRNFGVKSLSELNERLQAMGYSLEDDSPEPSDADTGEAAETPLAEE